MPSAVQMPTNYSGYFGTPRARMPAAPTPPRPNYTFTPGAGYGTPQAPATLFAPNRPMAPSPTAPNLKTLDYSSDPILQNVIAGGNADLAGERARGLDAQKQLLLGFGSKEMARKLLGNDPFVDTISDNPETGLSSLALSHKQEMQDMLAANEGLNQQNLFFSSNRGLTLADIARQRTLRDYQSEQDVQAGLAGIADQYSQAQQSFNAQRRQAESDAYNRAVQDAIASWYSGAGGPAGAAAPPAPGAPYATQPMIQSQLDARRYGGF